jgi:antitoxin CptB
MREMDLIMGRFADTVIADLSPAELDEFERLSGVPDDELYSWIIRGAAPADHDGALFRRLCDFQFRRNER